MLKKILAVLGLLSAAAFAVITVWLLVTGQTAAKLNLMLIPLCCFLAFGLLSLGIRWLENLKKERMAELEEEARKQSGGLRNS